MTFQLFPQSIPGRTMCKRNVIIGNVVEEVNLILFQHQASSDRMHRSVAPALIKESAVLIKGVEIVEVSLRTKPVEIADLEIGPLQVVNTRTERGKEN